MRARMRNQRGEYQTLDVSNRSPRQSNTAGDGSKRAHEAKMAEHRLRMIEKISKYREDKIKKEFIKLEEDLRMEDERKQREYEKELRQAQYHAK